MGFINKIFGVFKKKNKGIVVLSLFDGIGSAYIALQKAGIRVKEYYASEIDKYAIHQSELNFPQIKHLGDIRDITPDTLPKHIDLVIGGSPCQSFSLAGNREGMSTIENHEVTNLSEYLELKKCKFEFKGESYLFWEFVRILNEVKKKNPNVKFLLENVEMGKKWESVITSALTVEPLHLDSRYVSGQIRKRVYWTNITNDFSWGDTDPDNEHKFEEYLEHRYDESDYLISKENVKKILGRMDIGSVPVDRPLDEWLPYDDYNHKFPKCLTKVGTVRQTFANKAAANGYKLIRETSPNAILNRQPENVEIRIFTPIECANLQTIPEDYKWDVSSRQMYKLIGNGWTIDVIEKIISYLKR